MPLFLKLAYSFQLKTNLLKAHLDSTMQPSLSSLANKCPHYPNPANCSSLPSFFPLLIAQLHSFWKAQRCCKGSLSLCKAASSLALAKSCQTHIRCSSWEAPFPDFPRLRQSLLPALSVPSPMAYTIIACLNRCLSLHPECNILKTRWQTQWLVHSLCCTNICRKSKGPIKSY
jgi:hypothetical protein